MTPLNLDGGDTATEGGNEPGVMELLLEDIRPAEQHRPSKHRHGRLPKMTANQRRLFGKWTRAGRRLRMQHAMDATALRRALESSGE